jgi:hypothetical protein
MALRSVIRYDRVKEAIYDAVAAILYGQAEVIWADQGIPRPGRAFVEMRIVTGPSKFPGVALDSQLVRWAPEGVNVDLASVTDGVRYRLRVNERPFDVTATATDTTTTVRAQHVALINASTEPVTAAAGLLAGDLDLTPDFDGALVTFRATPASTYTATPSGGITVIDHIGPRRFVVSFTAYVGTGNADLGAQDVAAAAFEILSDLETGLGVESTLATLENLRISSLGPVSNLVNLTGVAAVQNEGRVTYDHAFSIPSVRTEAIDVIEAADVTFDISGNIFSELFDTTP